MSSQHDKRSILNAINNSEYSLDEYHYFDHHCNGHRYCNRFACRFDGLLVGKCDNDKWYTNGDGELLLRNSIDGRLWECESNGKYYGEWGTCLCSWYGIVNTDTDGEYSFDEYYPYNDECNGHRHCDRITCGSYGSLG
jgi:hypothetical protein